MLDRLDKLDKLDRLDARYWIRLPNKKQTINNKHFSFYIFHSFL